jgi:hypothetical protein
MMLVVAPLALGGTPLCGCNAAASDVGLMDAGTPPDGSEPSEQRIPLVSAEEWRAVSLAEDPFAGWAPAQVSCSPIAGYYPEQAGLEIDTTRCNFVTLTQPLLRALPAGARIEVEFVHFDLTAPEPAEARLALLLPTDGSGDGGSPIPSWEITVPIPSAAKRVVEVFSTASALDENVPVLFHLQNHGQNTWRLLRVDWLAAD